MSDLWRNGHDMASTLSRLQSLQVLELSAPSGSSNLTLEPPTSPINEQRTIASLPNLSSFEVTDDVACIAVMLSHLSFPLACLVRIEAKGVSPGEDIEAEDAKRDMLWARSPSRSR